MKKPSGERDEVTAFAEAMRGARPLRETGAARVPPGPGPSRGRAGVTAARLAAASSRSGSAPDPVTADARWPAFSIEQAGESWSARAEGVDRRLLRKLAAGKVAVEGRIDLHGESRLDALRTLERFLAGAEAAGRRALLVIHGRGLHSGVDGPTLREAVRGFFTTGKAGPRVLACSSAPQALGGPGATLVWLRRAVPSPSPDG